MVCPLYPVHLVFGYGALLLVTWLLAGSRVVGAMSSPGRVSARVALNNSLVRAVSLTEGQAANYTFYLDDLPDEYLGELHIQINSPDGLSHLLIHPSSFPVNQGSTTKDKPPNFPDQLASPGNASDASNPVNSDDASDLTASRGRYLEGQFTATGSFLGFSQIKFVLSDDSDAAEFKESPPLEVKVTRGHHVLDKVFVHVVILLVVIVYINMGCAIDLDVIKSTLRRPVAPAIGVTVQYLFMPLCSYALGYMFLSSTPALRLGLFVTGCSPGGGGSNMWTYLLGGSLDLSVTMTFASTVMAFVAMPVWIWALGPSIFRDGQFDRLPFRNIAMLVLGLIVPISIGLALKHFCPKGAAILKRLLKPLSIFFIVFVMIFGTYAYWFIFQFFTWRVAVCGLGLPWLGFMAGYVTALATRRPVSEVIAITIETGLQNTGLAIGLLKVSLSSFSPLGDIGIVVPIAVATMTPLPLFFAYCVMKYRQRGRPAKQHDSDCEDGKVNETTTIGDYIAADRLSTVTTTELCHA